MVYDLKQEFKKQARDILNIDALREQVVRDLSAERMEVVKEQQRAKSVEKEKQRIEKLKDVDEYAYYEASEALEARVIHETEHSLRTSGMTKSGLDKGDSTPSNARPALFIRSASVIEEEKRKHRELQRGSTFRVIGLREEEDDAYRSYHASRTAKAQ